MPPPPGHTIPGHKAPPPSSSLDECSLEEPSIARPPGNTILPAVKYVRLYTDENGHSRFEDLEFAFAARDFAPPAPPLDVSNPIDASAVMMLRAPAGWADPAHPSPARQLLILVAGSWEVSAGGETRTFSLGDVVLTDDTSGPGHASTVLEDTVLAVVRL